MKRIISSLLIILMIITMYPIAGSAAKGSLYITSPKTINVESGDSVRIPIRVENTSEDYINNISIRAEIDDPNYIYLSDSAFKNIEELDGGDSKKFNFDLEIDDRAPKGSYKVNIEIDYYVI